MFCLFNRQKKRKHVFIALAIDLQVGRKERKILIFFNLEKTKKIFVRDKKRKEGRWKV